MRYKLNVSYNCGISYRVERESDNLKELKKKGKELDEQTLRWVIDDEDGNQVDCCAIHKNIVGFMEREINKGQQKGRSQSNREGKSG